MNKGDNVLLKYTGEGQKRIAVEIVPDLVKIPPGVTEIDIEKMLRLVNETSQQGDICSLIAGLSNSMQKPIFRKRFLSPGQKKKAFKLAALPDDRELLLIFYCLGGTCRLGPSSAALAVEAG